MYTLKSNYSVPRSLNGLFEEMFNTSFRTGDEQLHNPPVNVMENENGYTLHLVAPGFKKEDFKVQIDKNLLHISYEHKQEENKDDNSKWLRTEYKFRSFKRTFTLNEKVDAAGINASYNDGILAVVLPKKEETEKAIKDITVS